MKKLFLAAALLLPLAALTQTAPLLSITDPEGDDVGDGSLSYPRDGAFTPGDLDLRSLRVYAEGKDLRFEATFRNPIRDPASARGPGLGSEDLSVFARRGFYAFNLDIYLDTDRIPGSGNTVTLPGRGATLDPAHAWEKAIVLTPRPELMKRQLVDALREASPATAPATVEATVDRSVYFATQVRVRGRTVSFVVPGSFVDANAVAGSSLTAIVTLAKLAIEAEINLLGRAPGRPIDRLTLGAAQPEAGRPQFAMGYSGTQAPATAVVDLLSPDPRQQATQLATGALLSGLNRDNQMGAAQPAPASIASAARPVAAIAPSSPDASGTSWFSRALGSIAAMLGAGTSQQSAPATAAANPQSLQSLMAAPGTNPPAIVPAVPVPSAAVVPAAAAAARPAPAATSGKPRDAAYFEEQELRLRTLKRLRDNGLINEAEYQQKRREVLDGL